MMAWPTMFCGILLVFVGIIGYATATPNEETGKVSPTALIPAAVGAVLLVCGWLAFNDKLRKHVMHLAAMIGLIGIYGGTMPLQNQYKKFGEVDLTKPAAISGMAMTVICAVFVWLCVNSFIAARKARQANAEPQK